MLLQDNLRKRFKFIAAIDQNLQLISAQKDCVILADSTLDSTGE